MNSILNTHGIHHFTHVAMATQFDLFIHHENKEYAAQAAWEAIKEIDRLENELSRFKPNSDISRINNLSRDERIILSEDTFNCILAGIRLYDETFGAFNIACGALLKCRLNPDYTLRNPTKKEIAAAKSKSRIEKLILHPEDFSIEVLVEGTIIDLGALGKGYTIDRVSEILNEWEIKCALISAGRSSIKAIGTPPDLPGWEISISNPVNNNQFLKKILIKDVSVGASGLSKGNHIINTISGEPEVSKGGCWTFCDNAVDADAFSTAFMILKEETVRKIVAGKESLSAIVVGKKENLGTEDILEFGMIPSS